MLNSLEVTLNEFNISAHTGFLPDQPPLWKLNTYYKVWEDLVSDLPSLLRDKTFRATAGRLPVLSVARLHSETEWRRAYTLLSFISSSYIWGGQRPAEVCYTKEHYISCLYANVKRYYLWQFLSPIWPSPTILASPRQ